MGRSKRDAVERMNPKSIDPDTGKLYDASEPPAPKRSGFLDKLKRAATDAAMRRVSTKR
jgi:hypothetical protein